jgi:hypothetical protein
MMYEVIHRRLGIEDLIRDDIEPVSVKPPDEVCREMHKQAKAIAESGENELLPRAERVALTAALISRAKAKYAEMAGQ